MFIFLGKGEIPALRKFLNPKLKTIVVRTSSFLFDSNKRSMSKCIDSTSGKGGLFLQCDTELRSSVKLDFF